MIPTEVDLTCKTKPTNNMAKTKTTATKATTATSTPKSINTSTGKVTKPRKAKASKPQKRILASAIPGELVPYITYIDDDQAFLDMVEETTRTPAKPDSQPVTHNTETINFNLPAKIQPPSLADIAVKALTEKPKRIKLPKTKKFKHAQSVSKSVPKVTRNLLPASTMSNILPSQMTNTTDLPSKLAVKKRGAEPLIEDGHFDIVLNRKSRRLLRQPHELPDNFYKRKNFFKRATKRLNQNARKIELLFMIKENIQLNVNISGSTKTVVDDVEDDGEEEETETENEVGDRKTETESEIGDDGTELHIDTPEDILQHFEKAEAAIEVANRSGATNESGIVPGKKIHHFNKQKWTEKLNS